jgi:Fe2+ or Zn2+ uptake regulation protein
METAIEFLKEALRRKGIRPSYHRIKVLEYLHQKQGHPTVDEIYASISAEIPSLSRATIYNSLHTFVEAGLARVIPIDGIEKRYDIALHNHGHFKCEGCGAIYNFTIDIDSLPYGDLEQFEISEKSVYFAGLCPNCLHQRKEKRE